MKDSELQAENEDLRQTLNTTITDLLLMRKSLRALVEMVQLRIESLQKRGGKSP
jgi:hypothetical protein